MYYIALYYEDKFFGFVNSYIMRNIRISQHISDAPKYKTFEEAEDVKNYIEFYFKFSKPIGAKLLEVCNDMFEDFNYMNFKLIIKNLNDDRKYKILSLFED